MEERHVIEELGNIVNNYPVWPGDTIGHRTADECGRRGWARRNVRGYWMPTGEGVLVLERQEAGDGEVR